MSSQAKEEHREILENHFLFSSLDHGELSKLLATCFIGSYVKNRTIFVRGEEGDRLYAILKGRVKISIFSEEGREIVLAVMREGDFFGEIAFLDGSYRTADATVVEDSEILSISRGDFFPLLDSHPDIYMKIIRVLCERLRQTNETIEDSIFLTISARCAKTLMKLAASYGQPFGEALRISIKISQQELANIIGTSREVVNRHLRQLQNDDVIHVEKGHIVIDKPDYLEEIGRG